MTATSNSEADIEGASKETYSITKTFVEGTAKPGFYNDDKLKGFALKVTPTGLKVYQVYGKVRGERKPVRVTIGRHGEVMADGSPLTAVKAREEAERIRGLMRTGVNPNYERKKSKAVEEDEKAKADSLSQQKSLTLRAVFEDYIKVNKPKASTAYNYRCDLFKCLADWLDKPLLAITKTMVIDRHIALSESSPSQANHVMRILRALFNFAIAKYEDTLGNAIFSGNPVTKLSQMHLWNEVKPRTELIEDHQLQSWFQAVSEVKNEVARDYLLFLLLTGVRKAEAERIKWSDIDSRKGIIRIVETKNGDSYDIPITEPLRLVLQSRRSAAQNVFVFPGQSANTNLKDVRSHLKAVEKRCIELLVERAEDRTEKEHAKTFYFTHHSLRRTFTTAAGRLLPTYIVAALTNHKDSSDVTQTHYVHFRIDDLREPMKAVNDHLMKHANVNLEQMLNVSPKAGEVISIRKRA